MTLVDVEQNAASAPFEAAAAPPAAAIIEALPAIPLVDIGEAGPLALLEAEPSRAAALLGAGERDYGRLFLRGGEWLSRRWLLRAGNPYLGELEAVATRLGRPGAHLLNLSYEWFCTSGVATDPTAAGSRMLRTLDWPLDGLGRHAVVARQDSEAGPYYNIT